MANCGMECTIEELVICLLETCIAYEVICPDLTDEDRTRGAQLFHSVVLGMTVDKGDNGDKQDPYEILERFIRNNHE